MKKYLNKKTILILTVIPLLVLIFFVARHFLSSGSSELAFDYIAIKFKEDGKISLMDKDGKIVMSDEFASGSDVICTNGIIAEYVNGESDYVRYFKIAGNKLEEISKRKYNFGTPFNEGYALVRDEDGILNLIDKKGNETSLQSVEGTEVVRVAMISDGLLRAKTITGEWGYINPSGNWAIKPSFRVAESFVNGNARVIDATGDMLVINKSGKEIMKGKESFSYQPVSEGLIGYSEESKSKVRYYGFLNTSHEKVIKDNKYTSVLPFFSGYSVVESEDGMYGVIDKKGEIFGELRTKFKSYPLILKNGFAVIDNEKLKLFDDKGVMTKALEDYDNMIQYNDELLVAKLRGKDKYDLINLEGTVLSKESFLIATGDREFYNRNGLLEMLKSASVGSAWFNFSAIYNVAFRDLGLDGLYGLNAGSGIKQVMQSFDKVQGTGNKNNGNRPVDTDDDYRFYFQMEKKTEKEETVPAGKAPAPVAADTMAASINQGPAPVKDPYPRLAAYVNYYESADFYSSPMRFSLKAGFSDILKSAKYDFVEDPVFKTMNYQLTGYELSATAKLSSIRIDCSYGSVNSSIFIKKMEEKILSAGWKKERDGEYGNPKNSNKLRIGYGFVEFVYTQVNSDADFDYNEEAEYSPAVDTTAKY